MKKFLNISGTFLLPDSFDGNRLDALKIATENFINEEKKYNKDFEIFYSNSTEEILKLKQKEKLFAEDIYRSSMISFYGNIELISSNKKIKIIAYRIINYLDIKYAAIFLLTEDNELLYCQKEAGVITIGINKDDDGYRVTLQPASYIYDYILSLDELISATSDIFDFTDMINIDEQRK
jgi:hypothetical protein